jgi:hypothetical protein
MSLSTAEKLRLLLSSNSSQAAAAAAAAAASVPTMAPVLSTSSPYVSAGMSAPAPSRSASVPTPSQQLLLSSTSSSSSASSASASSASASISTALSSAVDNLIRTYELPVDSSALEQIELCLEAALLCSSSQAMRKFGFFLVQAAGLYQELHQYAACTAILQSIQPIYRIHTHMQRQTAESAPGLSPSPNAEYESYLSSLSAERRFERGVTGERWVAVQRSILEHIIYTAHKTNGQSREAGWDAAAEHSAAQLPRSALTVRWWRCRCAAVSLQRAASAVSPAFQPRPAGQWAVTAVQQLILCLTHS